jgi:hypothetical protein
VLKGPTSEKTHYNRTTSTEPQALGIAHGLVKWRPRQHYKGQLLVFGTHDVLRGIPRNAFGRMAKSIVARWFVLGMTEDNVLQVVAECRR